MHELGEFLKTTREQQGITLDDLQQRTKIRKRYLEAIEAGDISSLPGMVYTRGFIKTYADELGISGQELLEKHGFVAESSSEPVPALPPRDKPTRGLYARKRNEKSGQVLMTIGVLGLLAIGYWLITGQSLGNTPETQQNQGNVVNPPLPADDAKAAPPQPASPPSTPAPKQPEVLKPVKTSASRAEYVFSTKPSTLVVEATDGDCWMDLTVDKQKVFSGILKKGQRKEVPVNSEISLTTGNSTALTVKLGDQPVEIKKVAAAYNFHFIYKQ